MEGAKNDEEKKEVNKQREFIYFIHGIGLTIAWTFLIDIALFFKKFLKFWKYSLQVHVILSSSIGIYTAVMALTMLIFRNTLIINYLFRLLKTF